jgi:hypothetical protein
MITFILKVLILVYLFYMIKYVYDMLQFNQKAALQIIENPDKDKIVHEIKQKCPLLINHLLSTNDDLSIELMHYRIPGYIVNDNNTLLSLEQLHNSASIKIHKNKKIIEDYNLQGHFLDIEKLISNYMACGSNHYISLYRGGQSIPLTKNYREYLLLKPLSGKVIIYLFNPKHEKDIKGVISIKKWGIKVEVTKDKVLYIPPEWSYIYETKEEVILSHIEMDSYPSFLFNYIRKK